jgi:multidrug resistance efflux pump
MTIDEATNRLAAFDRELAGLQRQRQSCSATLTRPMREALREKIALVRAQRDQACRDLLQLIELDEMPAESMGWA